MSVVRALASMILTTYIYKKTVWISKSNDLVMKQSLRQVLPTSKLLLQVFLPLPPYSCKDMNRSLEISVHHRE